MGTEDTDTLDIRTYRAKISSSRKLYFTQQSGVCSASWMTNDTKDEIYDPVAGSL